MFLATTTVSIFRDSDADDRNVFGDETETGTTPITTAVPASVVEDRQDRFGLADLRQEKVEYCILRMALNVDVREGDRLHDERANQWHQVVGLSRPQSPTGLGSIRVATKRIGTQA
jgi:hypothetical protein